MREWHGNVNITICKTESQWEFAVLQQITVICCVLCDNLEGWDRWETGGRFKREGTYGCPLWLIHVDEWYGGSVDWCSHYGKQYGSLSNN